VTQTPLRAVLFDAVGTLIYPEPPVAVVYADVGRRHGVSFAPDEIAVRFHEALRKHAPAHRTSESTEHRRWSRVVAEVFVEMRDTSALFDELWRHFADHRHWRVYDDVPEAWRELEGRGLILGIASNFDDRLRAIVARLPPLHAARELHVSSRLGFAKPHPGFFQAIAESLQLHPGQLLLVGDDRNLDFHAARRVGWHSLLLRRDKVSEGVETIGSLREVCRAALQLGLYF